MPTMTDEEADALDELLTKTTPKLTNIPGIFAHHSDLLESLHETAVGLHNIGVISDKEMREYDKDCLAPTQKKSSETTSTESTSVPVKPITVYAKPSRQS